MKQIAFLEKELVRVGLLGAVRLVDFSTCGRYVRFAVGERACCLATRPTLDRLTRFAAGRYAGVWQAGDRVIADFEDLPYFASTHRPNHWPIPVAEWVCGGFWGGEAPEAKLTWEVQGIPLVMH